MVPLSWRCSYETANRKEPISSTMKNRKPKEIRSYKEGKLHGLWRSYDPSGQLISEAEYRNGLKHGTWRIWDELGNLRYEMNYRDSKKVGNWRMWNERGELVDEKQY